MTTIPVPTVTALRAQATANYFLLTQWGDRFVADAPTLDAAVGAWRVPILLAYAGLGPLGQVGEIQVSFNAQIVVSHTPWAEMKAAATVLYEQHREAVER